MSQNFVAEPLSAPSEPRQVGVLLAELTSP